jgi:hypothetical protein
MQMINLAWLTAEASMPRQFDGDKPQAQWPNSLSNKASSLLPNSAYLGIATPLLLFRLATTQTE